MKQLTKEMKSVFTTWYNVENNEYRINYGYLTYSNDIACNIYDWDNLLVKIKYWNKKDPDNYIRYTNDKNIKKSIKNSWIKYA
jgi:hypothetical protein